MATQAVTKPIQDKDLVLRTLALHGNSPMRTRKALETVGLKYTDDQIIRLRATQLQRFQEIRTELAGQAGERMAQKAEDVAMEALEVQQLAVDEARKQLVHGSARDPSGVARNLASVAKEASTQAALIRGTATQIVEVRNVDEILRSLEGKLPKVKADADTTAEEVQA